MTPSKTVAIVSALYGVKTDDVWGDSRNQRESYARSICYYLMYRVFEMSGPNISALFGRSKTSITKGSKAIEEQISVDKTLRNQIERITWILKDEILMGCGQE